MCREDVGVQRKYHLSNRDRIGCRSRQSCRRLPRRRTFGIAVLPYVVSVKTQLPCRLANGHILELGLLRRVSLGLLCWESRPRGRCWELLETPYQGTCPTSFSIREKGFLPEDVDFPPGLLNLSLVGAGGVVHEVVVGYLNVHLSWSGSSCLAASR